MLLNVVNGRTDKIGVAVPDAAVTAPRAVHGETSGLPPAAFGSTEQHVNSHRRTDGASAGHACTDWKIGRLNVRLG